MSTISSATSCDSSKTELAKLQQKVAERLQSASQDDPTHNRATAAAPKGIEDFVGLSQSGKGVAPAQETDFGTSFDALKPGQQVDITA